MAQRCSLAWHVAGSFTRHTSRLFHKRRCGRSSGPVLAVQRPPPPPPTPPADLSRYDATWLWQQSLVIGGASAVLGPLCDGQHSSHGVLRYVAPVHLALGPLQLETCWWVPAMFALAGIILGLSHPLLDAWQAQRCGEQPRGGADPSWPFVLAAIAFFVLQYWSNGALEQPLLGRTLGSTAVPALDAFLFATAALHWAAFDGTRQGLFMAALTAVAGPAVEIALINGFHLYSYTHPVFLGTPTWICWVYACGAPAVGNLGRKVSSALLHSSSSSSSGRGRSGSKGSPQGGER